MNIGQSPNIIGRFWYTYTSFHLEGLRIIITEHPPSKETPHCHGDMLLALC